MNCIGKRDKVVKLNEFKSFEDFYWLPETLSLSLGIDLHRKSTKWLQWMRLLTVFEVVIHLVVKVYMIRQLTLHAMRGELLLFLHVLPFKVYSIDSNMKFYVMFRNRKRISRVYQILMDCYPATSKEREFYRVNRHYAISALPPLILYNYISCWIIVMSPLIESCVFFVWDWAMLPADEVHFRYMKLFPVVYAFDHNNPLGYLASAIIETTNALFTINSLISSDMWLLCSTSQICMQLEAIARRLESYEPSLENATKDCEFLEDLIAKHQLMLNLYHDLNDIFGISLAFNLFSTSCLLCAVAVFLTVEDLNILFFKFLIFLFSVIGHFYFVCDYGQKLIASSIDIALAAYKSKWYNGSPAYKKLLLMLIMRSQKQAALSAKGFQIISLNTFQSVLVMTYRVYALLHTMIQSNYTKVQIN